MPRSLRPYVISGFLLAASGLTVTDSRLQADEGMWTFAHPPIAQVRDTYGFSITQPWLWTHLVHSCAAVTTLAIYFIDRRGILQTSRGKPRRAPESAAGVLLALQRR